MHHKKVAEKMKEHDKKAKKPESKGAAKIFPKKTHVRGK